MTVVGPDSPDELAFDVAPCTTCGKDVLTAVEYASESQIMRACVHCGEIIDAPGSSVRGDQLDTLGYSLVEESACGSGSCGSGRCGRSADRSSPSPSSDAAPGADRPDA